MCLDEGKESARLQLTLNTHDGDFLINYNMAVRSYVLSRILRVVALQLIGFRKVSSDDVALALWWTTASSEELLERPLKL